MMVRISLIAAAAVALCACRDTGTPFSGASYPPVAFGSAAAADSATQGCASGQHADLLHQNRPGGSDYNPLRCHSLGY